MLSNHETLPTGSCMASCIRLTWGREQDWTEDPPDCVDDCERPLVPGVPLQLVRDRGEVVPGEDVA